MIDVKKESKKIQKRREATTIFESVKDVQKYKRAQEFYKGKKSL